MDPTCGAHMSVSREEGAVATVWAGVGRLGRAEREEMLGRKRPNGFREGFLNFFE